MEEIKTLKTSKEALHLQPMIYVGKEETKTKRYYMYKKCGVVIYNENGEILTIIPNSLAKRRPNKFLYAGPYMLIGNTIYYNGRKTKYHCNEIYYDDGVLECDDERNVNNKFFIVKGRVLKRAFFRRLNTGDKLDLIESIQRNQVIRLKLGGVNTSMYFYGKSNGSRFYKSGPMAKKLAKLMNDE